MVGRTVAAYLTGTQARIVSIEAEDHAGLAAMEIIGTSETAARDTRVRVRSALTQAQLEWPLRAAVRVLPEESRRGVASLDVAIAIALHAAVTPAVTERLRDVLLFGELSLGGSLRPSRGLIPHLLAARAHGLRTAVIPFAQLGEASLVQGIEVLGAATLREVADFLHGDRELPRARDAMPASARIDDLPPIRGLECAMRALTIAAAGRHPILLIGQSGSGKTMLARRVPALMPAPALAEIIDIATVRSAAGLEVGHPVQRPFRAPHHTVSTIALLGGGDPVRPGEVTLASGGVLFLDELPELRRGAIDEVLRAARDGEVTVHRRSERITMPASALVVGATAPCACGLVTGRCACTPERIAAYFERVPLDCFEMHILLGGAEAPRACRRNDEITYRIAMTIARLDGRCRPNAADVDEAQHYRLA